MQESHGLLHIPLQELGLGKLMQKNADNLATVIAVRVKF